MVFDLLGRMLRSLEAFPGIGCLRFGFRTMETAVDEKPDNEESKFHIPVKC